MMIKFVKLVIVIEMNANALQFHSFKYLELNVIETNIKTDVQQNWFYTMFKIGRDTYKGKELITINIAFHLGEFPNMVCYFKHICLFLYLQVVTDLHQKGSQLDSFLLHQNREKLQR